MILHKSARNYNMIELADEAFKKADEIYAKEEEDNSHHSTCSLTSCSICSNSDYSSNDDENLSDGSNKHEEFDYNNERPLMPMKKSLSADILNHPPLPKFPRYQVRRADDPIPPLPLINDESHKKGSSLTTRSLDMLNTQSDEVKNSHNPLANQNHQSSILEILPLPSNMPEIDQTLGIPLMNERVDNMIGMAFYPSLGPHNNVNDDESYQIPTTIHQYPLISATIPSTSHAKMTEFNVQSMQFNSIMKEPIMNASPASILSNPSNLNNSNTSNTSGTKKDSGEKNKVKFSDTIHVAVVPEIPRKEKFYIPNERMMMIPKNRRGLDPRRELAESLPLYNPEEEYLKDFSPVTSDRKNINPSNIRSPNNDEKKKSSNIKVVHFGVV
jgi:WD repeat-containing and planar cell polarity effector protein